MAEKRILVQGHTLNVRTAAMLQCAENRLGYELHVMQGSYNTTVSASAGTHNGGGAVDVSPTNYQEVVAQLRAVGFAAWHRYYTPNVWPEHVHAIAIGDPELSSGAETQVHEYYSSQDGLADHAGDNAPRPSPVPVWPIHFPTFSLTQVRRQFKSKKPQPKQSVRYVQEMLNKRLNLQLKVDGIGGQKTKTAFASYRAKVGDKSNGYSRTTTNKLIAGYYKLKLI